MVKSGTILLPPSPNWFLSDALDCRSEDGLLVAAAFKAIVVYHISSEERLPKILKLIPYQTEKVLVVRLHPSISDVDYGNSVASLGDEGSVRLHSLHTGTLISQHTQHKESGGNGLCWGSVGGEEVVVSVGSGGQMVVWQPKYGATRVFTLKNHNNLTVVEADPKDRSRVLVVAERSISLVSVKDGRILMNLHGHDYAIYCLRWYPEEGSPFSQEVRVTNSRAEAMMEDKKRKSKQPEEEKKKVTDSENWRSDSSTVESSGPYFASSDYGRNVLIWDLSSKKYVTRINVPLSGSGYKKQPFGKDRGPGKQHIPLAWHKGGLLTSTIRGELLQWNISPGQANYKALHHLHTRAIYTLHVAGNTVITTGQDRLIQGYDLSSAAHSFTVPTLGGCATGCTFCPHDANRLAIGTQENIRILNLGSEVPLQALTVFQNIKGKVMSLMWHPEHETRLLFGTGSGQVGWTDAANGRTITFAYYHQRAVYKVEWGPPVCPEKSGIKDAWCVYSFGDKELVVRSPSDPMADPVRLHSLVPESEGLSLPKDITEFSFSPDYKFIAIGTLDGQVVIVRHSDMVIVVRLTVVRKAVQHLLWQPPAQDSPPNTMAVASNENKIYIFYLDTILNGGDVGQVLTQAGGELCGHEARVVWLAWSPHNPSILASASYDHTIQIWDTAKGEPLVNYGGHTSRVFRVEFSPCDPDLMYSVAEENCVHTWRPSHQKAKTPADSNAVLKDYKKEHGGEATSEESTTPQEAKDKKGGTNNNDGGGAVNGVRASGVASSTDGSVKKVTQKSFFPRLHKVTSRKKSFHHLLIINMLTAQSSDCGHVEKVEKDDTALEDDLEEEIEGLCEENGESILQTITQTSEKYQCLLEKDGEMADPSEFKYALSMYGTLEQVDSVVAAEIQQHEGKGNLTQASIMHCWRGSLDQQIQWAARHHKLTPFLVAAAPQVSHKLWEMASEAYAEQLVEEGDVITGATYLVNINKVKEAVDALTRQKHFREAYIVARCRLGYDEDLRAKVVDKWVSCAIYEGNYDLAATLQLSQGEIVDAARTLSRRIDPGSLFVAAQLYQAAGQSKLAEAMGLSALREASVKQEMAKIDPYLSHMPELNWYQTIFCCQRVLLSVVQQANKQELYSYRYLFRSGQSLDDEDGEESQSKAKIGTSTGKKECLKVGKHGKNSDSKLNGGTDNDGRIDSCVENNEDECTDNKEINGVTSNGTEAESEGTRIDCQEGKLECDAKWVTTMERVRQEWEARGITRDQHKDIYKAILTNFSTQLMPSSLKQVWFLVSVAVTESLLAETTEAYSEHLTAALQYTLSWGKADQVFHLTHLLLPRGPQDLSTLASVHLNQEDLGASPCIHSLRHLYHLSEIALIHSYIQNDKLWPVLQDSASSHKAEAPQSASTAQEMDRNGQETLDVTINVESFPVSGITDKINTSELTTPSFPEALKKDGNKTGDSSVPGIAFQLPHSVPELLATLNSCLDSLSQEPELKIELGSGLSGPDKIILNIANLLRGKGCSEDEIQSLIAKVHHNGSDSS